MLLLYILSFFAVFLLTEAKKLSLTSISTLQSKPGSIILFGSELGGTVLYIKGTGFHQNPSLNEVFVGNYPCIVPQQGTKEETLTCTTSSIFPKQNFSQLAIVVISNKQKVTAIEKFTYGFEYTPSLTEIYPSHSFANQKIRFVGSHKITDLGNGTKSGKVKGLFIGDDICNRNGINQKPIDPYLSQSIECIQAPSTEAGKYSIKEQVTYGYARKPQNLLKTSLFGQKYEFTILPTIESFSPNNGSVAGEQLTIKGSGFPASNKNKSKIQVTLDNTECQIVQTSTNEIRCNLKKRSLNSLRIQDSSNTSAYTHVSGSGFKYTFYEYPSSLSNFLLDEQSSPQILNVSERGVKGQLYSLSFEDKDIVEIHEGYFYAVNAGRYAFIAQSSAEFMLYLNPNAGVPSINISTHLFISAQGNAEEKNPYDYMNTNQYKQVTLESGKYYFMKAYFKRSFTGDKFKVYAQVPNTNLELGWKAPQMQQIKLNFTNQPLIYRIRSLGAISGYINISLFIANPDTLAVIVNISKILPYDVSPQILCTGILQIQYSFQIYKNTPKCTLTFLDENLNTLPSNTPKDQIFGYEWIVQYQQPLVDPLTQSRAVLPLDKFSVNYIQAESFNGEVPYFTQQRLQDQGYLINGTFNIISKGAFLNYTFYSVDFPYNTNATTLEASLRKFYNNQKIFVTEKDPEPHWNGQFGKTWTIRYDYAEVGFPDLQFVTDNLTGGEFGTYPKIYFQALKNYGQSLLYDPLSFQLMKTFSSKPSLIVTVNKIPSVCPLANCEFKYIDETPKVSYLTMNSTQIVITLTSDALKIDSKVQVKINDEDICSNILFQGNTTVVCTYLKNSDGFPIISAGSYHPSVYIQGIGYLEYDVSVPELQIQFLLSDPSPVNGSVLGSYPVTLKGKGLPKFSSQLSIKVCDIEVQILQKTPASVTFLAPQIKAQMTQNTLNCSIKVQYQNYAPAQIFDGGFFIYEKQLSFPTITSLSKSQSNPTKKGVLQIFGSGFDINGLMNKSSAYAFLRGLDNDRRYEMRILEVNDTRIKVGLSGGLTGNYELKLQIKGKGFAKVPNQQSVKFSYKNSIQSILPSQGSYFGGRQIKIIGNYFSPDIYENQVLIGDQNCAMVEATQSTLKCLAPPKDESSNVQTSYQVSVMSRQISKSICQGDCNFTYMSVDNSPIIISMTQLFANQSNQEITIQGRNLLKLNEETKVVAIHRISMKKTEFIPLSVNDTHIVWKTKPLAAGQYFLFVNVNNVGYSNITIFTVKTVVSTLTNNLSTQGGILSIKGFGFPQQLDEYPFELMIKQSATKALLQPKILSISPQQITIQISGRTDGKSLELLLLKSLSEYSNYPISFTDLRTPKATIVSSKQVEWKNTSPIIINITSGVINAPAKVTATSLLQPLEEITVTWEFNLTHVIIQNNLEPGTYRFKIFNPEVGYYQVNDTLTILMTNINQTFTFATSQLSVEGGYILVQNTLNSLPPSFGKHSSFLVNGVKTQIKTVNQTFFKLFYPSFIRSNKKYTQEIAQTNLQQVQKQKLQDLDDNKEQKNQDIELKNYVKWSDSQNNDLTNSVFDSLTKTTYFSSNPQCQIGVYFGQDIEVQISKIKFYPNKTWQKPGSYLKGAIFQGSSDNITWKEVSTLNSKVQRGWNTINFKKQNRASFRYFRFVHTSNSGCSLGELQIKGTKISNKNFSSIVNPVSPLTERSVILSYSDGVTINEWKDIIFTYSDQQTPVIQSVQPSRGNVKGGQIIELTGTGLGAGTHEIIIDDKICSIIEFNETTIKCLTSPRLQTPLRINFEVFVNGKTALVKQNFRYVNRWSDEDTWGVDLPPIQGDLIYIPKNMHLLIDQSTPKLAGIIAQDSTIQIADELDIEINTANIILTGAQLLAGTPQKPHIHKLTFNFYGVQGENQIPFFGNKGIGCSNCKVILHGKQKQAWTRVSSISRNQNKITSTYPQPLNWQIGDEIVVSSSSFDYLESQKLKISYVNATSSLLDLQTTQAFKYDHTSSFQRTKTDDVFIGAQIASLSRNIKFQGDSNSDSTQYGIHLTFIGQQDSGLEVKISNVEFKNCGQPKKSRHCINFNRNADMLKSYIKNSTASQTYAKFISVSSTNFLTMSSNVGYRVKGHNIELKDGTEQNNVIEGNLMISSLPYYRDLQTDVMVASYYISNPNNVIQHNVAAGSYYYGILYDFKIKSQDGIYAQDSICTSGFATALNKGNTIHSVRKIGVRIKDLISRQNPCQITRNDNLLDPWSINPTKESLFENYVIYRVGELGLMCDDIGHIRFKNFTMAENNKNHMQFHVMNYTKENVVVADSTFIGVLNLANIPTNLNTKSLVLPRSGSIIVTNVLFSKHVQHQTLIQTCSLCDQIQHYTNNGQEYFFDKVQYLNINKSTYLQMLGLEKEIIYDNDGTFTSGVFDNTVKTKATVMKSFQHILSQPGCNSAVNQTIWDGSVVCGANLTIRRVTFMNILPENSINFYPPYVSKISNNADQTLAEGIVKTVLESTSVSKQILNSWSAPFVTGSKYLIRTTFQPTHFAIQGSKSLKSEDKAIIFKFNYNLTTQLFDTYKMRNLQLGDLLNGSKINNLNSSTCQNGDYYHNNTLRDLEVCISGKNTTLYEMIDITPIKCRYECPLPPVPIDPTPVDPTPVDPTPVDPTPPVTPPQPYVDPDLCIREDFVRSWSNATQWPSKRLPLAGQNVTVHCNWTMILDVDPAPVAQLIIDGNLIVYNDRQLVNVTAESIWVRSGSWVIGNQTDTFNKKMVIQINGNSNDRGFAVDQNYAASKTLLVTGKFEIYGPTNFNEATSLTSKALPNSTSIKVNQTTGWNVGDEIILSTSSRSWNQSQKVKIVSINGQQVEISPPLQYLHYGSLTPQVSYQDIQLYTATKVIYVTRNIKIVSGPTETFGFSISVYGYIDKKQRTHMGSIFMRGVELVNGGQGGSGSSVLGFKNTVASTKTSQVTKCSFVKCNSECVKLSNAKNLIFQNNVLYDALRSHIRGVQLRQTRISSNIMIHSTTDPKSSQNVSVCLENKQMLNSPYEDNVTIFSNECYGSKDTGFILPYLPCSKNTWKISKNIAGGCLTGFFLVKLAKQTSMCMTCENQSAFNCKYGMLGNPDDTTSITYNKLILIGNQQGLILRMTTKQKNNTAYLKNSFISPVSNKDCLECNTPGGECSNNIGVRLLSVTESGAGTKFGFNSTEIRSSSPLDGKTFVLNTSFSHFKINYSQISNLQNCQQNFIFKAHDQAIDLIGSTYLYDIQAVQTDNISLVYFKPFDTKYLGLEGGCGEFNCTSLENYLIQDFSGSILGTKRSKALPNNLGFSGKTVGCEFVEVMNGYLCNENQQVAALQFESIARDHNTRITWPISLISTTNDTINNTLNVEKEWSYRNGYPEGKRKARVSSLIKLNTTYNLTFYSRAPSDMIFQIQQKSPTIEDFAWVRLVLQYPDQNSIRIKANDKDMNPIILLDNQAQADPSLQVCGSYKYVYSNKYIEFILTTDCKVRMSFVSSLKATIRLDQAVGDFFTNNGTGKFIDKMCVILGITDTSRLKIVGVYTGSTIIDFYVEEQQKTVESNATSAPSSAQSAASLQQLSQQLDQAVLSGQLQTALVSAGLGSVLSITSSVVLVNETGQFQTDQSQPNPIFQNTDKPASNSQSNKSTIIIVICVVSVGVMAVLAATIIYLKYYKKPNVIESDQVVVESKQQEQPNMENELSIEKSSQIKLSYFEQRKQFNIQSVKRSPKVIKDKFAQITNNNSQLDFKNPFDQHYNESEQSYQQINHKPIELVETQKFYKK